MERVVPITEQSPCAVLHWTEADRSESGCWETAQKRHTLLSSPPLSFTSPLLFALRLKRPRRRGGAEPLLLCGGTYVSWGQTDFRPGVRTEGDAVL